MSNRVGVHKLKNGTLEVLGDGTKIQKTNDGTTLVVRPDGSKVQTMADVRPPQRAALPQ